MSVGFYGKLPSRGDFVRSGLPRGFTDPWDAWFQRGITATRDLGADWVAAWLEAPVWRFRLPPGCCGEAAALGLWMPSVDRAGRYFPLTIAAVGPASSLESGFLDDAGRAGLDALANDLAPDVLAMRIARAYDAGGTATVPNAPADHAVWWTEGGPRVSAQTVVTAGLPEATAFAAGIDGAWTTTEVID